MREYTTITEVDERGRMLMPLAVRKALGIENKRALLEIKVSVVDAKKEESENPLMAHAPELLLASA
jgi:bifunctional DNA-binding transcriptional regulator/antitoxin component of YhaV-PrlF toxin-antitoxin module